ncbi:MAG: hypothetical protein VYE77_03490, partial [Planctomycetota bacterium]|nr:hypothetical protein [Planctomycetota bacterium]
RDLAIAVAENPNWKAQPVTPSAELQRLLRHAPPGLNGYAQGHIGEMYAQIGLAFSILNDLVDVPSLEWEFGQDNQREEVMELLTKHGLLRAYSMTGYDNRRWHHRMLW